MPVVPLTLSPEIFLIAAQVWKAPWTLPECCALQERRWTVIVECVVSKVGMACRFPVPYSLEAAVQLLARAPTGCCRAMAVQAESYHCEALIVAVLVGYQSPEDKAKLKAWRC